jgi:hypothetical protein
MNFKLNTDLAKSTDAVGTKFPSAIKRFGKFIGTITQAEFVSSEKARGLKVTFLSDGNEKATFSFYTDSHDGAELPSKSMVMSLMAVLKLREIENTVQDRVSWNYETKSEEARALKVYPALEGKKVGVLLDTEDNDYNGKVYIRTVPVMFFQADTELSASEVLDRETVPKRVAERVLKLRHRPASSATAPAAPQKPKESAMTDDDVPF